MLLILSHVYIYTDDLHLFWFQQWRKFGGESEYYLDLENEDKKWYKEKLTLWNSELLPDPNVSISLLLICL